MNDRVYIDQYVNPRFAFERRESERLKEKLENAATIDGPTGVIRWDSNGSVPPADCVKFAAFLGLDVDIAACDAARDEDTRRFLAEYRANDRGPDAEQLSEMRAAFGEGAEVVNIITGRRTRL